jgi:hypothetical protein
MSEPSKHAVEAAKEINRRAMESEDLLSDRQLESIIVAAILAHEAELRLITQCPTDVELWKWLNALREQIVYLENYKNSHEADEWKPVVKTSMPPNSKEVYCWWDHNCHHAAVYKDGRWFDRVDDTLYVKPLFWRPLPTPPEEGI